MTEITGGNAGTPVYPLVPCTPGDGAAGCPDVKRVGAKIGSMMQMCTTEDLMRGAKKA